MKTIALIFIPIYIERDPGSAFQAKMGRAVRKVCHILFGHRRQLQPFWTWFIDNPRSSSPHQQ